MSPQPKRRLSAANLQWRGLTLQLFTLIVLPLTLLLFLITFGGITLHQQAMRNLVAERDERATRTAARALNEQLSHRQTIVHSLAQRAAGVPSNENLEEILAGSDYLLADFDQGLAFFDYGGNLLASSGDPTLWTQLEKGGTENPAGLFAPGALQTFSPYRHPVSGEPVIFVAGAASDESPVALGAFSPAALAHQVLADVFTPSENAYAFLVDKNAGLLYSVGPYPEGEELIAHPGVAEALSGNSGATYIQIGEDEHVVAYSAVPETGWALIIDEPWESVASPLLRMTEGVPLVLLPVLIIAIIALWFGVRQVVQPLQSLEARAASLAWGDYHAITEPVGGIEEIQRLQRELIHLANKVRNAQNSLKGYIGAITTGQEDERKRLARELHDDTVQALIALNQRVQLARLSDNGEPQDETLAEIQSLTEQTIQGLRRITHDLRPIYLEDLGLVAALDTLARETGPVSGVPIRFQLSGNEQRLPATVELALYRIAQEGLSNITRHAQASQGSLNLTFGEDEVLLVISDDGAGFDVPESPAEFVPSGHFGLLGIHERAELIGATLKIESTPDAGTRLLVSLPIPVLDG